jgi:hypothetical protein
MGDDLANRIAAVDQVQLAEGVAERQLNDMLLVRRQVSSREQPIDRHVVLLVFGRERNRSLSHRWKPQGSARCAFGDLAVNTWSAKNANKSRHDILRGAQMPTNRTLINRPLRSQVTPHAVELLKRALEIEACDDDEFWEEDGGRKRDYLDITDQLNQAAEVRKALIEAMG